MGIVTFLLEFIASCFVAAGVGLWAVMPRDDGYVPTPHTRAWQHRMRASEIDPLIRTVWEPPVQSASYEGWL